MSQTGSIWLVLLCALLAANLPFLNERWFGVLPRRLDKTLWHRVLELLVLYFAVGALGMALEQRIGMIAPQGWEFYAITASLFLTFAFPGFVWRYLLKRR
jgi:hypothetical protein